MLMSVPPITVAVNISASTWWARTNVPAGLDIPLHQIVLAVEVSPQQTVHNDNNY